MTIIPRRRVWYAISLLLLVPGVISLILPGRLQLGIDFKGGTIVELEFAKERPSTEALRETLAKSGEGTVQPAGEDRAVIRLPETDSAAARTRIQEFQSAFPENPAAIDRFEQVGGSVATSTITRALWAVGLAVLALIFYIAYSFRGVPKPASSWRFGLVAIAALLHDILFVFGAVSLLGRLDTRIQVDALFITAILTILGFSMNDTIVVFDRIRENLRRMPGVRFADVSEVSLQQTIVRSLLTSGTVLVVLITLLLLGGESMRSFILALTLGVGVGTYSSIFTATPLLVDWERWVAARKTNK